MDPFALQDEMDAARTLRGRSTPAPSGGGNIGNGPGASNTSHAENGSSMNRSSPTHSNHRRRRPGGKEGDVDGSPNSHEGLCAEVRLRQKFVMFDDIVVGRGGFGEVFLGKRVVDRTNGIRQSNNNNNRRAVPELTVTSTAGVEEASNNNNKLDEGEQQQHGGGGGGGGGGGMLLTTEDPNLAGLLPPPDVVGEGDEATQPSEPIPEAPSKSPMMTEAELKALEQRRTLQRIHETVQDATRTHTLHDLVAIKRVDKRRVSAKGLSQLHSEVETLSLLNHSNVIRLHEIFEDDDTLWMVMEYIRGGELGQVLKRVGLFTESVARKMCLNVLLAIEYIHEKGIVHRDLKPANCLLSLETAWSLPDWDHSGGTTTSSSGTIAGRSTPPSSSSLPPASFTDHDFAGLKIADFGLAAMVGRADCLTSYCGTLHYMAPEVVGQQAGAHYGKPVDMWSCGVIAYNLLSGEQPFQAATADALIDKIMVGEVSFQPVALSAPAKGGRLVDAKTHKRANDSIWVTVSPQAKDFICKLLVMDPNKRLTASEALRHPWIKAEYSDVVEIGDYPGTKGILRAHSNFWKTRQIRHRIRGAVHAIIAAHRLVFYAKLMTMRREGTSEIGVLRNFGYLVHGQYEPPARVAHATNKKFIGNMAALKRFTDMVAVSKTVEVFDVSATNLDDVGLVQYIVKVAHGHHGLIQLNLERNPIPPLAARALLRLARTPSTKLSVINVSNTNLGADTIAQIDTTLKEAVRKRAESERPGGGSFSATNGAAPMAHGFAQSSSPTLSNSRAAGAGDRATLMSSLTSSKLSSSQQSNNPTNATSTRQNLSTPSGAVARGASPFNRPSNDSSLRMASPSPMLGGMLSASPMPRGQNAVVIRDAVSPTSTLGGSFGSPLTRSLISREMSPLSGARRGAPGTPLPPLDSLPRAIRGSTAAGGGTNAVRQKRAE